jgi:CBS domain-containing protein
MGVIVCAGKALGLGGRGSAFVVLTPSDTLLRAAQVMVHEGVHRVAVAAPGEDIVGVVTQTTVLTALRDHVADLGPFGHAAVGSLFPPPGPPFTLPASSTLRHCLQQLLLTGYEGCALTEDAPGAAGGAVVANISRTDVRRLTASLTAGLDVEAVLNGPVLWFLQDPALGGGTPTTSALKVITVTPRDSVASLVNLLCVAHVHRVHVVDAHRRPLGVVTAMDVIRALQSSELVSGWGR